MKKIKSLVLLFLFCFAISNLSIDAKSGKFWAAITYVAQDNDTISNEEALGLAIVGVAESTAAGVIIGGPVGAAVGAGVGL